MKLSRILLVLVALAIPSAALASHLTSADSTACCDDPGCCPACAHCPHHK
jgi:hypothetical protein